MSQFPLCEKAGLMLHVKPRQNSCAGVDTVIRAAEVEAYLRETTQQNSVKTESVRRNEGANYAKGAENTEGVMQGELVFRAEDQDVPHRSGRIHGISVEKANRILSERSIIVYGWQAENGEWVMDTRTLPEEATHRARLVCVEPLESDSADDLLKEITDELLAPYLDTKQFHPRLKQLIERARALRAKGGG